MPKPVKSRRSIIIIEGFYKDPLAVRNYALRQRYYTPYQDEREVRAGNVRATWWATRFRSADECPFKSSQTLIKVLEEAVGETIDMEHWRAPYPVDAAFKPLRNSSGNIRGCLWNCCFHVKPENGQQLGDGVHNHVTDSWNSVGPEGWAGLIYLNPAAPHDGGLNLWRNTEPTNNFDWMTPAENWQRLDTFANLFNRLVLVRGDIPHSGAGGWGDSLETGRMYQTFFFRTISQPTIWPVSLPQVGS